MAAYPKKKKQRKKKKEEAEEEQIKQIDKNKTIITRNCRSVIY